MRRKEREIKEFEELVSVIDRCEIIRIAMNDEGMPYIVPLNFGWIVKNGVLALYMHSATEGRKIDILKKNPHVCFEMDGSFQITKGDVPCRWTSKFESIIGTGTVTFIEDPAEKKTAMDAVMKHYGFEGVPVYAESAFSHACLYKLTVETLSGKRS